MGATAAAGHLADPNAVLMPDHRVYLQVFNAMNDILSSDQKQLSKNLEQI